jgi:hypothetical protein
MGSDPQRHLIALLASQSSRRLFYSDRDPLTTDAILLVGAVKAGVDLAAFAPIVAARIKRAEGWTVDEAVKLATPEPKPRETRAVGVDVECLAAILTKPRRYTWRVGRSEMEVGAADIKSRSAFVHACLSYIGTIPQLPKAKDWEWWLQEQVENAVERQVAEEATIEGDRKANIAETLRLLTVGETYDDLMAGRKVPIDGYPVVNFTALRREAQQRLPAISAEELRVALRDLGWEPTEPFRLTGTVVRGWRGPEPMLASTTVAQRIASAGNARRLALVGDHDEPFFSEAGESHD